MYILISRVEPLYKPEVGPTSTSHLSSRPCLGATLTSSPLKEPLIGTSSFHHEAAHDMKFNLSHLRYMGRTPIRHRCSWNPPMPLED